MDERDYKAMNKLEELSITHSKTFKDIRIIGMISNKGEILIDSRFELTDDEKKYIEQLKIDLNNRKKNKNLKIKEV